MIGKSRSQLDKFYFCFDSEVYFSFASFFEAFNFYFKFYVTYNIPYPVESENLCIFYQRRILDITRTTSDTELSQVETVLNKLDLKTGKIKKPGKA